MFQMNFIEIGEPIYKEKAGKYIEEGYKETLTNGILDDDAFWDAYSNNTYEPLDVSKLSKESIQDIANRHFNIKV